MSTLPLPARQVYVIDTNVLIDLALWHPVASCQSFWNQLADHLQNGNWILLDDIVGEIRSDQDLQRWCKEQERKNLIQAITDDNRNRAIDIHAQYPMIDAASGRSTVDTYLVAFAEANKMTIFTREGSRRNTTDLHKIPDVCGPLKIPVVRRPSVFYRDLGIVFS